ncbi:MAG: Ubiquitin-conjugating enzyme E2 6 [Vezdaea aestivalis]|nr:MAG: Ubiquitin-conjugating enzyme E2 6 [Vezdaea aestivalis]
MATIAASKRLAKEYQNISRSPPPFITAHPSEKNILEWHYILTGPPDTPYANGQYWGTLTFPPTYPFSPPAIRMHTPSGRFHPSARLCLSISDFHPKSFNPAWEVSTILIGLLSFMTSDEMTTGSVAGTESERRWASAKSRWWNSTAGGSVAVPGQPTKPGDGGANFRSQWPDLDQENWRWMKARSVDPASGQVTTSDSSSTCPPEQVAALARRPGGSGGLGAVVEGGQAARETGQGWLKRNRLWVILLFMFLYVFWTRSFAVEAAGAEL